MPSVFAKVVMAPPDPILNMAKMHADDKDPKKVNLGIGAYRTEKGAPWPLPSVRAAEKLVANDDKLNKEYIPIDGQPTLKQPIQSLIFSDATIASGRLATAQALSGTGALRVAGEFLKVNLGTKTIHVSDPTWGNHNAIFEKTGLVVKSYTYYKESTRGFDFEGMMAALGKMESGDAILLHACAHNPTGVDPNPEQWGKIIAVLKERNIFPVLDNAYQGYATGDLVKDGAACTLFENSGLEYLLSQSFAKNFGLYGERIGAVHVMCATKDDAARVLSQLKMVIRPMYSSPPRHGAAIVQRILTSPDLKKQWMGELKQMSDRIGTMRTALRAALEKRGTPGTWNHITDQIGMFSYTGLSKEQCEVMIKDFHIYLLKSGRISVAGLNEGNVDYVAGAIDAVVRKSKL